MFAFTAKRIEFNLNFLHSIERQIDGEAFSHLSRDNFSQIFPSCDKFILAAKLSKIVQELSSLAKSMSDTDALLEEMDYVAENTDSLSHVSESELFSSTGSHSTTTSKFMTSKYHTRRCHPQIHLVAHLVAVRDAKSNLLV